MEENHISQAEWTRFFSARQRSAEQMKLQSRILLHAEHCQACRSLYEKGLALRRAAQAYAAADAQPSDEGAYAAVASGQEAGSAKKTGGSLTVDIDAGAVCFMEDTLDAAGLANKYALNMEDGGRRLEDDGGALTLALEDGAVRAVFRDGGLRAQGRLLTEAGDTPLTFTQGQAQAALPPDDFCTLELFFTE